jgi:hypothetical protein
VLANARGSYFHAPLVITTAPPTFFFSFSTEEVVRCCTDSLSSSVSVMMQILLLVTVHEPSCFEYSYISSCWPPSSINIPVTRNDRV